MTQLRLTLDGYNQNDTKEARCAFDERAVTLLTKTFDAERATAIYARARASEPKASIVDGVQVWLIDQIMETLAGAVMCGI